MRIDKTREFVNQYSVDNYLMSARTGDNVSNNIKILYNTITFNVEIFQVSFSIIERVSKKLGVTICDRNQNRINGENSKKKVASRKRMLNHRQPPTGTDSRLCTTS